MSWTVKLSKKLHRRIEKLPPSPRKRLNFLVKEIQEYGPVQNKWPNYGKIRGKKDCYHCHFKKGDPTYVAVWKVTEYEIKIVEIKYAGTHEGINYNKLC